MKPQKIKLYFCNNIKLKGHKTLAKNPFRILTSDMLHNTIMDRVEPFSTTLFEITERITFNVKFYNFTVPPGKYLTSWTQYAL